MKARLSAMMVSAFTAVALAAPGGCSRKAPPVEQAGRAKELAEHSAEFKRELVKVADGVYSAVGFGLANSILLEGKDGLVIIDTMESAEAAADVKKAFDGVSRKPLKAVVLTHFHPDHVFGAGVFTGDKKIDIYSHEKTLAELDRITTLTQEVTFRRAMRMFGTYLGRGERENCGIGPSLRFDDKSTMAYRRPTKTFAGERHTLKAAGLKLELIHMPGETDDQIVVWMPDRKILICADNYYKSFPNLYTIRGTKYRDVRVWARSLERMRRLGAEHLVPCHSRPVSGRETINEVLSDYRDAIQFVHDQTVRGINRGLTPEELVRFVKLPSHLAEKPYLREHYGTVAWSVLNIFNGYLGWFGGDSARLDPLPPKEKAGRMARLAGGEGKLMAEARRAMDAGEHQWALELSGYLLALDPGDTGSLKLRSEALRARAVREGNANARNYYFSQAMEAEGKLKLTRPSVNSDVVKRVPLSAIFAAMGAKLDPEKSKDIVKTAGFRFTDTGEAWTVQVRRGVAFVEPAFPAKPDLVIVVPALLWKEIAAGIKNPAAAFARGDVKIEGGVMEAVKFLRLFGD